jgi:ABC-type amino acid transport substrate-binding protein
VGRCGPRELRRHHRCIRTHRLIAFALAVATFLVTTASGNGEARQIRLCADPSNPPFSSQQATEPGFEVEIARAIADAVGAEFSVHWFPTTREIVALRQLYEGHCDLLMGVPVTGRYTDDKPRLLFTAPYYVMTQVIVAPTVGGVASIAGLQGKLVGVQAMTLSDQLAYERGWNRKVYLKPEELFAALVGSEVDAAIVESVFAGPFLRKSPGFRALALRDAERELPIGAAVRKTDTDLKDAIDRALQSLRDKSVPDILSRYGIMLAQAVPPPASEPAPLSAQLRSARSTYLTQCSQCHGIDANGTPAAANLRAFKGTEDDFLRVVRNGRLGTAMTPWKGLIDDEDIRNIARYIKGL